MFGKINILKNKQGVIRKHFGFVVCASLVLSSFAAAPLTSQPQDTNPPATTPAPDIQPTDVPTEAAAPTAEPTPAPAAASIDPARVNFRQIVVKFKTQADQVSALSADSNPLATLVPDAVVQPMFQNNTVSAMSEGSQEAPVSDIEVPGQYYFLQLPEGKTADEAAAALAEIQKMDGVEEAYMEPVYSQASDHTALQTYLDDNDGTSAVNGIKASNSGSVWAQTGGFGAGERVTVIDYAWDISHQDISISASYGSNNDTISLKDHGTAILGILGGKGIGINGIVPQAQLQVSGPSFSGTPISVAQAIYTAAIHSRSGDVIVIPLQAMDSTDRGFACPTGCDCVKGSLPVEYTSAVYDVIKAATANGIIVVEAAGNGAADLDTEDALGNRIYGTKFQRGSYDSGAIMVGAGDSKTDAGATPAMVVRAPSCYSNYGERLDLQGWGDGIVTTGFGDLEGTDRTDTYTSEFGGTSGAAAIVAGGVASLQGIARARGYVIKPKDMRTFLVDTGTDQGGDPVAKKVGPLPDLETALTDELKDGITLLTPPAAYDPPIDTLRPSLDWTDFPGASAYGVIVAKGSSFNNVVALSTSLSLSQYTFSTNLEPNTEYYWKARVLVGGSWRDYTAAWNFRTPDISSIPLITTLYSPTNASSTADLTPTFTWKAPSTKPETGYNVQVSTEMSYDAATIHAIGDPDTLTYTPGVDLDGDTIYYWRVQSVGTVACANCTSAWTGWRSLKTAPDAPSGLAVDVTPAATDAIGSLRPVVSWTAVDNARAYKIKYFNGTKTYTVTVGIPKGSYIPPTSYTFSKKLSAGLDYDFYISVLGRYTWSEYSAAVTESLYTPPATPTLSVPKNSGLFTSSGFTWKQPTGYAATGYYIQVSTSSKFDADNPPYVYTYTNDIASSDLTFIPPDGTFNIDQKYYWRLKSYNMGGGVKQYSEWSKTYSMKTTPPEPTNLLTPADTTDVDSLRPVFTWTDITSARGYTVKYSYTPTGSAFKTVTASVNLSAVAGVFKYELSSDLPPNKTIYWKVASKGLYGSSNYTDPISFNTYYPPTVPVISSPGNGTVLGTFYQKLNWSDSTDSTKDGTNDTPITYDLQIDKSSSFNSDGGSPIFEVTSLPGSEYTITESDLDTYLVDAGKYYWRVHSKNSTGTYSRWTSAYSYTTPTLIKGTVFDATSAVGLLSTRGIEGTDVVCIDNLGSCVDTDSNGHYEIRGMAAGSTLTLKVTTLAGYMNSYRKVTPSTGSTSEVNFGVVEQPADGVVRIVVNWDSSPSELEAHLLVPSAGTSAVTKDIYCKTDTAAPNECDSSYIGSLAADPEAALLESYNMPTVSLPTPSPRLTRNPTHGYGPVVFDIDQADATAGYYRLAILQKTPAISTNLITISNANVQIYFGTTNITPLGVIWAPTTGTGLWWKVFDLYSSALPSETTITKYNTYTSTKPENPQ